MEHLVKFGQKIWAKREAMKLTQKDVAETTGLSDATIRFIEKGRPGVSIANWIKVADLLGLEFYLLTKKMSNEQ